MKKILAIIAFAAAVCGCKGDRKALLPNVSGKAGEVIVVIDKDNWEGNLGGELRELLACDCPYLAQKEPLYNLANVAPGGFNELFKVHRNIMIMNIGAQCDSAAVAYFHDMWAAPQCIIQVNAPDPESAVQAIRSDGKTIVSFIEQAERDRVIRNSIRYEEGALAQAVREEFGGSPHFPMGYKMKKKTHDFIWIMDEKQYTYQGVFIYRYPAQGDADELSVDRIVAKRNEILKANVPGMFENTWMTTGEYLPPQIEFLKYRGREFAQVRGLWDVENDFMGGPFVSQSFYSPDGTEVFVAEAFVYAPRYDKRQYLRQVESILFSWDWAEKE